MQWEDGSSVWKKKWWFVCPALRPVTSVYLQLAVRPVLCPPPTWPEKAMDLCLKSHSWLNQVVFIHWAKLWSGWPALERNLNLTTIDTVYDKGYRRVFLIKFIPPLLYPGSWAPSPESKQPQRASLHHPQVENAASTAWSTAKCSIDVHLTSCSSKEMGS